MIKLLWQKVPAVLRDTSEGTSNSIVRLVFRPHPHIRWEICTLSSLTSTRVSSGFILCRDSSRSFGSYQMCSDSISSPLSLLQRKPWDLNRPVVRRRQWSFDQAFLFPHFHLHFALCFVLVCLSIILAHMLDSLVRVTRRVIWRPLLPKHLQPCVSPTTRKICFEALNYV